MNQHQKINHFPGIYVLARKNLLGLHLMAMQNKFPE
jgi:tubulin polyglutamylase TTLL6/13